MTYITYRKKCFRSDTSKLIEEANSIINAYQQDGLQLTLRQLYYRFVAFDLFPESYRMSLQNGKWKYDTTGTKNNPSSYHKIVTWVSDGRLAGLISWTAIIDRTRNVVTQPCWKHPSEIIKAAAEQYRIDKWADQEYHVEVWVEKEALIGVIEPICKELDVSFLACRGYMSQSEMWSAAYNRLRDSDQTPIIIHLGDHDPSGIDMTRDIEERLEMFECEFLTIDRIALNLDQIEHYQPPPNPAKLSDSRCRGYVLQFGDNSWELDALEPKVLAQLIRKAVIKYRDDKKYTVQVAREKEQRNKLSAIAQDILDAHK